MTERIFAVDLGATWLRTALVAPAARHLTLKSVAATPDRADDARCVIEAAWRQAGSPRAVALATAPQLAPDGAVRRWPNRRGYEGASLLSDAIRDAASVALFDDATAAALSADALPRDRSAATVCISIGSGIGGGAVIGGVPLTGANGAAMDLGHMPVPSAAGLRCTCGRCGCLQAAASGVALRPWLPAASMFRNPGAEYAVQRATSALADAVAVLNAVFDPTRVTVAGGLGLSPLFERLAAALRARRLAVALVRHGCGDDAGLVGAAVGFRLKHTTPGLIGRSEQVASHAD